MPSFRGDRLRALREAAQLSQDAVARRIGDDITGNTVSRWERGQSEPRLANVAALAIFFGVSADYLLGISDEPAPREEAVRSAELVEGALVAPPPRAPDAALPHPDRRRGDRRKHQ